MMNQGTHELLLLKPGEVTSHGIMGYLQIKTVIVKQKTLNIKPRALINA